MISEFKNCIKTERNNSTKSIEEISSQIEVINQTLKDSLEKTDLESKYKKEQIKKMFKRIDRISIQKTRVMMKIKHNQQQLD